MLLPKNSPARCPVSPQKLWTLRGERMSVGATVMARVTVLSVAVALALSVGMANAANAANATHAAEQSAEVPSAAELPLLSSEPDEVSPAAAPQSDTVNGLGALAEDRPLVYDYWGTGTGVKANRENGGVAESTYKGELGPGMTVRAPSGKVLHLHPTTPANSKPAAPLEVDTENVITPKDEEPVSAVSKASELIYGYTDFGWPAKDHPLRVGLVRYASPAPLEGLIDATVTQLKNFFGEEAISVTTYSLTTLSEAVHKGEVDIFLASSGRYRRLVLEGARDLATGLSKSYPDPNKSEAVAMVVLSERSELQAVADLKGRRLVTSVKGGFTGYDIPMGELVKEGYDPGLFFAEEKFLGDGPAIGGAFAELASYRADVAFLRLCFLENYVADHPEEAGRFRVIHNVTKSGEVCQRSTDLYPAWTVATTARTDPRLSRLVTRALLQMPPAGKNGFYWGVATDYSSVDQLFERLHVGPYRYLDDWTLEKIWEKAKGWILAVILGVLLLVGHSLRVGYLVRIRTEALTKALEEQKKLEIAAREAGARIDRLEKMGAVAQLSSIFAHEMRQPLSAISLYLFAIKRAIGKTLGSDAAAADTQPTTAQAALAKTPAILEKLFRETERANDIVERVRLYAKADRPPRDAVSIRGLVAKAVSDLQLSARFRGDIQLLDGDDAIVTVDALGLELVFVNLLKNGLEAAAENEPRVVVTLTEQEPGLLVIAFEDNGPVLSPESQAALLGNLTTTKATGLGLGLSIVRGILEAHSARLSYRFKPEGGVIAEVTLPTTDTPPESKSSPLSAEAATQDDAQLEEQGTPSLSDGDLRSSDVLRNV